MTSRIRVSEHALGGWQGAQTNIVLWAQGGPVATIQAAFELEVACPQNHNARRSAKKGGHTPSPW
eukprot:CAMPEP_0195037636 /NCGR_PEP_ID=MMETSP0326_2-20130528/75479_1 /TAXON_ID=2866 ORGANISM="Crypthecodinium cohnii, Strain Seligo" /NCGR_SAMPLE_ID=MMETSP0326_2 /ASSEMBLY_ACC=CAM_ASM_000348 /LENGTH=64 /DNA_ID=CAMNT_0040063731 /DNA_START=51 /DNA_END=242 /DNA_ORIENTATION=-